MKTPIPSPRQSQLNTLTIHSFLWPRNYRANNTHHPLFITYCPIPYSTETLTFLRSTNLIYHEIPNPIQDGKSADFVHDVSSFLVGLIVDDGNEYL